MKELSKFSEIINDYDAYIIDLWGVIHDGHNLYPGVKQTMDKLKDQGKKCIFLSNAPRRASKVKAVLGKFGITEDYYIDAVSSGEVAYQIISKLGAKKYFYIGPEKDRDLMNGSGLQEVAANEAEFAVVTGFDEDNSTLEEKLPQIKEALKAGLKMYCVNPDLIVVRQDGTKMLCAGIIGNYYKEQGGEVEFIGKPYSQVYEYVLNIFNKGSGPELSSPVCYSDFGKRILAIGDGLETDIKGANKANIDSLLVLGGILKAEKRALDVVMHEIGATPTYIAPNFGW